MTPLFIRIFGLCVLVLGLAVPTAFADRVDEIVEQLQKLAATVESQGQGIVVPRKISATEKQSRKLIQAQVSFSVGDYDTAAILLYDFVEGNKQDPSYDEGLYYLGESLFYKKDLIGARKYFRQLADTIGPRSKYYRQSLERLIELSVTLKDDSGAKQRLLDLDNAQGGSDSIPYVRGKYAFYKKQYDVAMEQFQLVSANSAYGLQAKYFIGACHVGNGEIEKAILAFEAVVKQSKLPTIAKVGRRTSQNTLEIAELSHMALGRLRYEQEEPEKAIDEYLNISRKSDLFDEAVYEVAWVYVRNKEYAKAIRALELLALEDPEQIRTPEVRLLEASLRIRKARNDEEARTGNPSEEYAKATEIYTDTKKVFHGPYMDLKAILDKKEDPKNFLDQITGRDTDAFAVTSELPTVAKAWLLERPEIQQITTVETDLAYIEKELKEAHDTMANVDKALASGSQVNFFPKLAEKRHLVSSAGIVALQRQGELADRHAKRFKNALSAKEQIEYEVLRSERNKLLGQLEQAPDSATSYVEKRAEDQKALSTIDSSLSNTRAVVESTDANLAASEQYLENTTQLNPKDRVRVQKEIEATKEEIQSLRKSVIDAMDESRLVSAGLGYSGGSEITARIRKVVSEEHKRLGHKTVDSDMQKLLFASQKAAGVSVAADEIKQRIDGVVALALVDIREDLEAQRAELAAYTQEYREYDDESRALGAELVGANVQLVVDKLYDIIIKSDIGAIDVLWAQHEATSKSVKSANLEKQRELRTLRDEFSDLFGTGESE